MILARYLELTNTIAQLESERDKLRSDLLKVYRLGEHEVDGYKVTVTQQKRESLDKAKLLTELGAARFQTFVKETSYEVLRVKKAD